MSAEHERLCARGPRFGDGLDALITQLMQAQKALFEAALQ